MFACVEIFEKISVKIRMRVLTQKIEEDLSSMDSINPNVSGLLYAQGVAAAPPSVAVR
jgi:hypothetical protein